MKNPGIEAALRQKKPGNMTGMDQPEVADFDPISAVAEYRRILDKREAATGAPGKDEYERIARVLRSRWAEWQGEDSLHEMAFGEPEE
jgi:hypothetical protein